MPHSEKIKSNICLPGVGLFDSVYRMQVSVGLIHPSIMAAYMVYAICMRLITNTGRVDIGGAWGRQHYTCGRSEYE
jgi:hypothetical protein